jgi:hypothetical protein
MSESLSAAWTRVDVMRTRSVEETAVNCMILGYYRKGRKAIGYVGKWLSVRVTENVEGESKAVLVSLCSPTK